MKKSKLIFFILVAFIFTIAIIAPPIAKHYIVNHSKEMIGRQIHLEGLYANIFTGYTRLTGFELLDTNDRDCFVKFDTLIVKVSLFRLLTNELRVNRIRLVNPDIQIWQQGSYFNFNDLLPSDTDTVVQTSIPENPSDTLLKEESMAIAINNIVIIGGHLAYRDLLVGSDWKINDLQLQIPGVYFSGQNTDIGLDLNFNEGGSLQTQMKYNLAAGNYNLGLRLTDFAIGNLLPYLQQSMNVSAIDGLLSADLQLEGNTDHAMDITLKGRTDLKQFRLTNTENEDLVSAGQLTVDIDAINPEKQQFHFNSLALRDFKSRFDLYPEYNTITRLLKTTDSDQNENIPENTHPDTNNLAPDFSINRLIVENAAFVYNDYTLHDPFHFTLGNIQADANNLTLTGKNQIKVKSTLGNGGTIVLSWNGRFDDPSNQNINLQIKNLDLQQFTPYSLHYFGYPLSKGVLAFSSTNDIRNNYLDGRNKLDIYRCEVDKKRKDLKPEFNIPLRTALYIIKDVNDKIKMDLPVKGDINSPSFSYKKIIIKTLSNLLIKVAVSPFSFLANSLGLSNQDLKDIPFEVYQSDFTPEQFDRINQLATVLKAKPEMTLELQQHYNPTQGEQTLALFQAQKAYYLLSHPEISDSTLQVMDYIRISEISPKDPAFIAYLNSVLPADQQASDLDTQLLSLTPQEELRKQISLLAARRDQKLKSYLLHQGLAEKNIRLLTPPADSLKNYNGKNCYTFQMILGDEDIPHSAE